MICIGCDIEFEVTGRKDTLYCSTKCGKRHRARRAAQRKRANRTAVCEQCNQVFKQTGRKDQMFCSEYCQRKASRLRTKGQRPKSFIVCRECGTQVEALRAKRKKFCSDKCKNTFYRRPKKEAIKQLRQVTFPCPTCGEPVKQGPTGAKLYCSAKCGGKAHQLVHRAKHRWIRKGAVVSWMHVTPIGWTIELQGKVYRRKAQQALVLAYGQLYEVRILQLRKVEHHGEEVRLAERTAASESTVPCCVACHKRDDPVALLASLS